MALGLSGRQLDIMRILWLRGEASVADVQQTLGAAQPLAYSTVATVLARMERKGLVTHRAEGRSYHYRPALSEQKIGRSMVGDLVERIFDGSPAELVSHLLETERINARELARIKRLVKKHEALRKPGSGGDRG